MDVQVSTYCTRIPVIMPDDLDDFQDSLDHLARVCAAATGEHTAAFADASDDNRRAYLLDAGTLYLAQDEVDDGWYVYSVGRIDLRRVSNALHDALFAVPC